MAFYYFKSGGTATGDGGRATTARTGAFGATTLYYDGIKDIYDTATTSPAPGDEFRGSHLSDKNYSATTTIGVTDGIEVVCVDDANQENENTSGTHAIERTSGGVFDLIVLGTALGIAAKSRGVDYKAQDDVIFCGAVDGHIELENCTVQLTGTSGADNILLSSGKNGCFGILRNVVFTFGDVAQELRSDDGGHLILDRCSVSATHNELFGVGDPEGSFIETYDCDFTNLTAQFSSIMTGTGRHQILAHRMKRAAAVEMDSGSPGHPDSWVKSTSASVGTANDAYFDFEYNLYAGDIVDDTAIYRTAGAVYAESGDNYSLNLTTNTNGSKQHPLKLEAQGILAIPGASATQLVINGTTYSTTLTVKVHLARDGSSTDYQDNEAYIEFRHADGTNNGEGVLSSSQPTDYIAAGTDLTNETSLWTGLGGTNTQMSISKTFTIGTSAGNIGPGILSFDVFFAVASDDIWVCPQMDFS